MTLESVTSTLLQYLALSGVIVALFAVFVVLFAIARSIVRLSFSRRVLVLPFSGNDAQTLHNTFTEQLEIIAHEAGIAYGFVLEQIAAQSPESATTLVDLGPLSARAVHDFTGNREREENAVIFVADNAVKLDAVGTISFGGFSVSPESLFAVSYFLRRQLARRTIAGRIDSFGNTVRVSLTLSRGFVPAKAKADTGADAGAGSPRSRRQGTPLPPIVVKRKIEDQGEVLDLLSDLAFEVLRLRYDLPSETESWAAWVAFHEAYAEHVAFLKAGNKDLRDRAISGYAQAVQIDPGFSRAHYNLGNLLYDQYILAANLEAISHFERAAREGDATVRALAFAGLTMAYAQNVHRFDFESTISIERADAAAKAAVALNRDLEEAAFAQAWALQVADRVDDAIEAYGRVIAIPGTSASEMRIKSFALNNQAWLYLTQKDDVATAEALLQRALAVPNKNIWANLGEVRRKQGALRDALSMYEEAIALDPRYVNGLNEMGMVYLELAQKSGGASSDATENLRRGYDYHLEAIRAVNGDARETARLRHSFEKFRKSIGLSSAEARKLSQKADASAAPARVGAVMTTAAPRKSC